MGLEAILRAVYRGGSVPLETQVGSDVLSNLLVAQGAPPFAEMTRRGNGWAAMNTSALAALVVRPSTVANFTLFNNELAGGKSYIILRAFAFNLVTTAAQARSGLWLCVHPPGLVSPTNDITARSSMNARAAYNGRAICDTAMTVVDNGWFPWGITTDVEPTGLLPGSVLTAEVDGRIVVPPQCGVSTQVVSSVVGNTFTSGFMWYEEQLAIVA